jgi:hypothetical protein
MFHILISNNINDIKKNIKHLQNKLLLIFRFVKKFIFHFTLPAKKKQPIARRSIFGLILIKFDARISIYKIVR